MAHSADTTADPNDAARRLRTALDASAIGTWEYDLAARQMRCSALADSLFDLPHAEQGRAGAAYLALVAPDDRERVRATLRAALGDDAGHEVTFRVRRSDGRLRWLEARGVAVGDAGGEPLYLAGTLADTTGAGFVALARTTLADPAEPNALARQLADLAVPQLADYAAVYVREGDGTLRLRAWHASDAPDAPGEPRDRLELVGVEPGVPRALEQGAPLALRGDEAGALAAALGLPAVCELLIAPLAAGGRLYGALVCAIGGARPGYDAPDLTLAGELAALATAALERLQLAEEALQAVRSRDNFITVAAHDLRSPLTVLLGQAQILEKRAAEDGLGPRITRSVQSIRQQSARLDRMISSLLDLSRLQSGRLVLDLAPFDLCAMMRRIVGELQPTLTRHAITCVADDDACLVLGDEPRLEQVFQALLGNAVKFSPGGGTVLVRIECESGQALITVADQGVGIAADRLGQLFEEFQRSAGGTTRGPGLRIGLYVVREIIRLHGGSVAVESQAGVGSTFTVRLPLVS